MKITIEIDDGHKKYLDEWLKQGAVLVIRPMSAKGWDAVEVRSVDDV